MGCVINGVSRVPAEQRLNVYALVIYVPDPLGRFLDDLRRALVPDCNPHAHVSVLPPRPISADRQTAREQVREITEARAPFDIGIAGIGIFPVTNVIYLELGKGAAEMHALHSAMNSGALHFDEPFPYHPHITLVQNVPADQVEALTAKAREMWASFDGPREFRAERAAFVQNTLGACWIDLAEYALGAKQNDLVEVRKP
jgi:2'-5' RNA ligase